MSNFTVRNSIKIQMNLLASESVQQEATAEMEIADVHRPRIYISMPPSFFLSLRGSPLVRNLGIVVANPLARDTDFTGSLSADEKRTMNAKAAARAPVTLRIIHGCDTRCACHSHPLLCTCTPLLELIDDCSPHVSLIEMFTLFPSCKSYLTYPSFFYSPTWIPLLDDGLHTLVHVDQRLDGAHRRCWDPLRVRQDGDALARAMCTQPPRTKSSLILVDRRIDFTLHLCQTVMNMDVFDSLHRVSPCADSNRINGDHTTPRALAPTAAHLPHSTEGCW
jgi:hypothetical protein